MSDLPANIEISPQEVEARIARGDLFLFVDVREKWEHETARIEASVLIPLREIPAHVARLAAAADVVLYCHHGLRSLDAAAWLHAQGVTGAKSLAGGIERWAVEVDPSVPRY
jgi:rhodanese-related sulfurtransferase